VQSELNLVSKMSTASKTCEISPEVVDEGKKFKLSKKTSHALILKINKEKLMVEIDTPLEDATIEDVANNLPDSAPRYILYSYQYKHSDGRSSNPLVFIFYCPRDINPTLNMLYASTKTLLINTLQVMKTFDIQVSEDLNEQWLNNKLKLFD